MKKFLFLTGFMLLISHLLIAQDCHCDHVITLQQSYIDGSRMNIQPGDTICIEAGKRVSLKLFNFHGAPDNYIVFRNCGGAVEVENYTMTYGIAINNSGFFRFTGTGSSDFRYGIRILGTKAGASGLGVGDLSTNFEIDHIEIANTGFAGIFSKTDPVCDLSKNRGNFTQYQSVYRDNYIHNTGGEGMYIGHAFYSGWTTTCDGKSTVLYPSELKGVRIYNNVIDSAGWDGIQVGCATEDCEVYGNVVTNYGTEGIGAQHSGIQIGGGTTGKCYNNKIINGSGIGLAVFGLGNNDIYNNIIVNAGYNYYPSDSTIRIYGIFCDDRETIPGSSFNFYNNTIINSKSDGIRFISVDSRQSRLQNNIIIHPGSLLSYSAFPNQSPYINTGAKTGVDAVISHNYFYENASLIHFADTLSHDYRLTANSPAIDAGIDLSDLGINLDINNEPRPFGSGYDIGAYEYSFNKSIHISPEQTNADANVLGILPGDTVYLDAGNKSSLRLVNFRGSPNKYVQIKNYGGPVIIKNNDQLFGMKIANSAFFRFTGTGTDSLKYGIKIMGTKQGAVGLSIDEGSTDFEVDHIEVANAGSTGIISRTNTNCDLSTNRGNFTQYHSVFHDNYVHNAATEGISIGHLNYTGQSATCNGQTTILFPSVLKGVRVYSNIVDSTYSDGIRVYSAIEDCEIYGNSVTNYGLARGVIPKSGILLGNGTTGNCYNNYVADGPGNGIVLNGLGNSLVFNNIIANAGRSYFPVDSTRRVHGILCEDKSTVPGQSFGIYHNTIVNPKSDGIRFASVLSTKNKIQNNIIIKPGALLSYLRYYPKQNPYINVGTKNGIDALLSNNYMAADFVAVLFEDSLSNYRLQSASPAIDAGINLYDRGIAFDFDRNSRSDGLFDIGAFEFQDIGPSYAGVSKRIHETENILIPEVEEGSFDQINPLLSGADFSVFPNPSHGSFKLIREGKPGNFNIIITNPAGQVVYRENNVNEQFRSFNLQLDKGIYQLNISTETKVVCKKVILH